MKEYTTVIGLEVHVQLNTASKAFCADPNKFGQEPNTNISSVSLALPGTLPRPHGQVKCHHCDRSRLQGSGSPRSRPQGHARLEQRPAVNRYGCGREEHEVEERKGKGQREEGARRR